MPVIAGLCAIRRRQAASLRTVAAERGWTVTRVFIDRPTTKKGRDWRPGQTALIEAIRSGSVERVMLYGIDRVGRTVAELVGFIEVCRSRGVALHSHSEFGHGESNGLSLFDFAGMMTFHVRQSRRERILRGQAAARAVSVRFGRPSNPCLPKSRRRGRNWLREMGPKGSAVGMVYRQHRAAELTPHWRLASPLDSSPPGTGFSGTRSVCRLDVVGLVLADSGRNRSRGGLALMDFPID